jgi:quinol-cytochrome oxidoreductase complex cytochrome b subunit
VIKSCLPWNNRPENDQCSYISALSDDVDRKSVFMNKDSLAAFIEHIHPRFVPEASSRVGFTFCLGGLATLMFLVEIFTGSLLLLYYAPSLSGAYQSVQRITYQTPFGFVFRNLHYWGGQFMVILVVFHMVRVFWTRSYLAPRRLNWVIGIILLALVFFLDFTGYLLVWDDRALWAWTIARHLTERIPLIGDGLALAFLGPLELEDLCLIRLYAWHIFILPVILIFVMALHFWKIRKDGGISTPL